MFRHASLLSVLALALALASALAAPGLAAADQQPAKQMSVHSQAQVKSVFDIAAGQRGRQAIEISCSPAGSDWCAKGFVAACDKAKGGLSSNDEGEVTCSLPQWK